MQRIDGSFLYLVGSNVHPLANIDSKTKLSDAYWPCYSAKNQLEQLLGSVFRIRTSREATTELVKLVESVMKRAMESKDEEELVGFQAYPMGSQLRDFEAVLSAEFRVSAIYLATQKKGLDPATMIDLGWEAFPTDMPAKVPATMPDARDAMRAIMFELPTAAGFHLHRANESVLRCYWDAVTKGVDRPKDRNMGTYLRELEKLKVGDRRNLDAS